MGLEFGKNARKQIVRGDIVGSFQYVNEEPALCIWRLGALNSSLAIKHDAVVVICLSSAFKYADDRYLIEQSKKFAAMMGFGDSKFSTSRIAMFIQDMLIELCTMPPEPISTKGPQADVSIRGNSATVVVH